MTQIKARCASKPLQSSCQFSVVPFCGSAGFGLTLNGGREAARNAPLAVCRLLKGWAGTVLWSPAREPEGTLYSLVLTSSPSFVGVLAICPSYNTLHSCSLATSCSILTESHLWASPMPRSWSGFTQAAPALPRAMQASLRPTLASLRGRGLEVLGKEIVGFPGERGLGSVRSRRGSQSGESGVLGGKNLVVSVGWSL